MKVLVTGATGFVGNALLKALHIKGHEIVVLTRNIDEVGFRLPVLCEVYQWNPEQGPPESSVFKGVDAVVHLAGENIAGGRWTKKQKERIRLSRLLSTRHLVQAIGELKFRPKVLVSASAIGFYGGSGNTLLTEDVPPGNCFLSKVCRDWEQEAMHAEEFNIRVAYLRTGIVLGKEGGAMKKMLPPFQMGLGGNLGTGKQWMSWIHVQDLIQMYIHTIETESIEGVYNAVSPNPVPNAEFTRTLGKQLQCPTRIPIPKLALKVIFGDMAEVLVASQNVSAEKITSTGFRFKFPDLPSALNDIADNSYQNFQIEQWVPQPVSKVFSFFSESKNLEVLTPNFLSFKVLRQSTEKITEGTRLDYSFRLHGIPVCWQSLITDWQPNFCFSDIQTKGPYSVWEHTHEFEEKNGGTLMRDNVRFKVPFGAPGDLLLTDFIQKDLKKIFNFRIKKIEELLGQTPKPTS